jgi:hypothetical protein
MVQIGSKRLTTTFAMTGCHNSGSTPPGRPRQPTGRSG